MGESYLTRQPEMVGTLQVFLRGLPKEFYEARVLQVHPVTGFDGDFMNKIFPISANVDYLLTTPDDQEVLDEVVSLIQQIPEYGDFLWAKIESYNRARRDKTVPVEALVAELVQMPIVAEITAKIDQMRTFKIAEGAERKASLEALMALVDQVVALIR